MRTLHNTLMGITLVALLALGAGLVLPGSQTAVAQHGHAAQAEAQAHFDAMVEELGLDDDQRAAIAPHFGRGYMLLLELHEVHAAMAAEMTESQRAQFAGMMHHMLEESAEMQGGMHEEMHGDPHEDGGAHGDGPANEPLHDGLH